MSNGLRAKLSSYNWNWFAALLLILTLLLGSVQQAFAVSGLYGNGSVLPPANRTSARHSLRLHDGNGNNPVVKMSVYTGEHASKPADNTGPTIYLDEKKCKEYYSGASITAANSTPSGGSDCKLPKYITVNKGSWLKEPQTDRWYKAANLTLSSSKEHVVEFTITMLSSGYYIGYGANTNEQWTAMNDRDNEKTTYTVEFAMPPCSTSNSNQVVGIYDPNHDVKLKLYEGPRTSSASAGSLIKQASTGKNEKGLSSMGFTAKPSMKYRFTAQTTHKNDTISMYWPYDTVYAAAAKCYAGISLTTTATTKNADGSSGTTTVEVNPSLPGSQGNGKITWTHKAVNSGASVTTTLSYPSTADHGMPAAPAPATHSVTLPQNGSDIKSTTFTVSKNTPNGTKYCQQINSSKTSATDGKAIHSDKKCVTVKLAPLKPYLTVYGSDVVAGLLPGACTTVTDQKVRSWNHDASGYFGAGDYAGAGAQAAVFATGNISHFSSALNIAALKPTGLSFANRPSTVNMASGIYGGGFKGSLPAGCDVSSGIPTATYDATDQIISSNPDPSHNVYIKVVGHDVYIDGNITYATTSWGTLSAIPSFKLVVEGGNIYIKNTVSKLDGLYAAIRSGGSGGDIYTCATGPSARVTRTLSTFKGTCNTQLKVNGSFMARNIYFDRSYGTIDAIIPGDPVSQKDQSAELFTYGPEMWLPNGSGSNTLDILSYQGLPPVL